MMLSAPPVPVQASIRPRSRDARYPYSLTHAPTKTPVRLRRERFGRDAGMLERLDGDFEQ